MSRLGKMLGKSKTFDFGEGENKVSIDLKPLKIGDLDLITKISDKDKQGETMREILKRTLKRSVPDATDEEIDDIGLNFGMDLITAILEVNGLDKMVDKKKLEASLGLQ